jgi:hypothetical protein
VNSGSHNRRPRSWEPNPAGLGASAAFWPCWFRTHLGKPFENRRQRLQVFNKQIEFSNMITTPRGINVTHCVVPLHPFQTFTASFTDGSACSDCTVR